MDAESTQRWMAIARHTPLAILCDLDGTLVPFARTPEEACPDAAVVALVTELASLPGVTMAIVSGRPKDWLERFFPHPSVFLMAEHGGQRRGAGAWEQLGGMDAASLDELVSGLQTVARRHEGAMVERKTLSAAIHYRQVPRGRRGELLVEAFGVVDRFREKHPAYERLEGSCVVEVRPALARKSAAVAWLRGVLGSDARLLALGDDVTDEQMFAALGPTDEAVVVRHGSARRTAARHALEDTDDVRAFLRWLHGLRAGETPIPTVLPTRIATPRGEASARPRDLVVVSNRLPDLRSVEADDGGRKRSVGGLVSALEPALRARGGMWLGWSGRTVGDGEPIESGLVEDASESAEADGHQVQLAWVAYRESWYRTYYAGMCNATLWPLFHSFPSRVALSDEGYAAYVDVHEAFADVAAKLVGPRAMIWAHDYHLLSFARAMRRRGHTGPIGHFLHIPFPSRDMFEMLPWAADLLDAMLEYDLLGFHTPGHVLNFLHCVGALLPAQISDDRVEYRGHTTHVIAAPIGIMPEAFQETPDAGEAEELENLVRSLGDARLVLGVDRLDYTKGIPERLLAFEKLLETHPQWRGKVSLIQVSVPSRADVPLYAEQRASIESIVGRINGEYGEASWVPIRYLYRSYPKAQLAQLYRLARVGYVTPLRDGMNLVAKEYVAAQDPEDPGVLLLSKFAGAAVELSAAVLTNPYHAEGMARDLHHALLMDLPERKARHQKLRASVEQSTAITWAEQFLQALSACR